MEKEQREPHPEKWDTLTRIQYLLDHWRDIFDPNIASSLNGIRGGGSEAIGLPEMARSRSVVKLAALLGELATELPLAYRHLKAYRCNVEWRQVRAMVRIQLTSGRWDEIPGWKIERIVPSWVSARYVEAGERFLEEGFGDEEVFLPPELWDGLVKALGA